MPEELLSFVESQSEVQLHVINHARQNLPMQHSLLASLSLHKLDYTIYIDFDIEQFRGWRTEFLAFKNLMLKARNLRSLSLDATWCTDRTALPDFNVIRDQMYFTIGDSFPALEELTLSDSSDHVLHFHGEIPNLWVQCTDFSQLQRLDLGCGTHANFMLALTGHVPQLKSLTFGMMAADECWSSYGHFDPRVEEIQLFLQSIIALERVTFWSATSENTASARIRQILLEEHGESLKYFDLKYQSLTPNLKSPDFEPMDAEQVQQLVRNAPDLQELKMTAIVCQREAYEVADWKYIKRTWTEKALSRLERFQWNLEEYSLLRKVFGRHAPHAIAKEPLPSVYQIPHYYWKSLFEILFPVFLNHRTVLEMYSLRHLTLCIHLRREVGSWYQFATRHFPNGPYDVNEDFARHTVKALFSKFPVNSAIESVTLEFKMDHPEQTTWTYAAQRKRLNKRAEYCVVVEANQNEKRKD